MDRPPDSPANTRTEGDRATERRSVLARRLSIAAFMAAGIWAVAGVISWWWWPAVPAIFGFIEANEALVGAVADATQIVTFVLLIAGGVLGWLGLRNWPGSEREGGEQVRQTVDVGPDGRGAAVSDMRQGVVVVGDHSPVSLEISGSVTYDYPDVTPSSADPDKVVEAQRKLEGLPLQEVPEHAALPPGSVMRLPLNPNFVGRREDLMNVAAVLKAGNAAAVGGVTAAAIGGLGGVGKTQLASEFVYCYDRYFHSVYWLNFGDPSGVVLEVAACGGAGSMDLRPDFHTLPVKERVRAVMGEWQSELPRLLVFDNCEDERVLERWLPRTGGCRVLLTSHRENWDPSFGASVLSLGVLSRQKSLEKPAGGRPDPLPTPSAVALSGSFGGSWPMCGEASRAGMRSVS